MYYRLFIGFDTGIYLFTLSKKPDLNNMIDYSRLIQEINTLYEKSIQLQEEKLKLQKELVVAIAAKNKPAEPEKTQKNKPATKKRSATGVSEDIISKMITYPSKRIFTDKDNNVVTRLSDVNANTYLIRFLTEDYKLLFEIKNPPDDYFIIEKVNFHRAGWYQFEIYKNELLLEENKFYISSEEKK